MRRFAACLFDRTLDGAAHALSAGAFVLVSILSARSRFYPR